MQRNKGSEYMNIKEEIFKSVDILLERKLRKQSYDRTFLSVVSEVHENGTYTIMNEGQKHKVKCVIPNIELKTGQQVWITVPCGDLKGMFISGVR